MWIYIRQPTGPLISGPSPETGKMTHCLSSKMSSLTNKLSLSIENDQQAAVKNTRPSTKNSASLSPIPSSSAVQRGALWTVIAKESYFWGRRPDLNQLHSSLYAHKWWRGNWVGLLFSHNTVPEVRSTVASIHSCGENQTIVGNPHPHFQHWLIGCFFY